MILASAADKRLSELVELADSVLAVAPPSVAALQPDIAGRAPTTALHDIQEQISRLADTCKREGGALYVIRAQACAVEDEVFCCFLLDATYSAYGPVHVR
ncbi:hypothetical protein HPB50_026865 [Hyalomma asiaticum]|uniref:Uncharacterized protein n=1 Tax=Hyalomma asiaticum TaxID=266040 RepID=A0ACB7S3B0_HYAAI|nr:hypothetical protein HPB50_026865 [Hyalomma asiaticum]